MLVISQVAAPPNGQEGVWRNSVDTNNWKSETIGDSCRVKRYRHWP